MFYVRLQGGLGNMMFQMAFGEYKSMITGIPVGYTGWYENLKSIHERAPYADCYNEVFAPFRKIHNHKTISEYVPFIFTDVIIEDGVEYIGYFQSEEYFGGDDKFIKYVFSPFYDFGFIYNKNIEHDDITCSVHIRHGDYLNIQDYHPVLPKEWYQKATKVLVDSYNVDKFLVFSDDKTIDFSEYINGEYHVVKNIDYIEMLIMSQCTHHIIANSSFSWWGAYLGNKGGVTVAPKTWFGPACKDDPKDIIPKNWMVI